MASVIALKEWNGRRKRIYTGTQWRLALDEEWLITHCYCIPPASVPPPYPDTPEYAGDILLKTKFSTPFSAPARSLMDIYYRVVYGVDRPDAVEALQKAADSVARITQSVEQLHKAGALPKGFDKKVDALLKTWSATLSEGSGALMCEILLPPGSTLDVEREPTGKPLEVEIRYLESREVPLR